MFAHAWHCVHHVAAVQAHGGHQVNAQLLQSWALAKSEASEPDRAFAASKGPLQPRVAPV
jgi:hypothetical protein